MRKNGIGGNKMNNKEWIDFLSFEFHVSRARAREMLHALMVIKNKDDVKKALDEFNKRRKDHE